MTRPKIWNVKKWIWY